MFWKSSHRLLWKHHSFPKRSYFNASSQVVPLAGRWVGWLILSYFTNACFIQGRIPNTDKINVDHIYHFFSTFCSYLGEGNGNPLQCSCLENPRDGGAWWTAIYGVAQSRTRLKRLNSSPSTTGFIFLTPCLLRERFKAPISTQPPILFTLLRLPGHILCSTTVIKSWRFHLKTNN